MFGKRLAVVLVCPVLACLGPTQGYIGPETDGAADSTTGADAGTADAGSTDEGATASATGDGDGDTSGDGDGDTSGDGDGDGDGDCTASETFSDDFASMTYTGGVGPWASDWFESGGGADQDPATGTVRIELDGGDARLALEPVEDTNPAIARQVDLDGACSVILRFGYRSQDIAAADNERITVQGRPNATASWVEIAEFPTENSATLLDTGPIDMLSIAASTSEFRIRTVGTNAETGLSYIDDVEIVATFPG